MGPDSFLNPLSPELRELGDSWYPSFSPSYSSSMNTPADDGDALARMDHSFFNSSAVPDHNHTHKLLFPSAMDLDSFLNPLSPDQLLHELGDWYPSSSPSSLSHSMETPADTDDAQARLNHPFLTSPAGHDHNSHGQDAPYRSVLMLSDVASSLLQGFSPAKPGKPTKTSLMRNSSRLACCISNLPPPGSLDLSEHGHAVTPTGTFKRSSAEANLVANHPAVPSSSALPPAHSPSAASSSCSLSASPPLQPLSGKRPSKRMKTSNLCPTSTVISNDIKPFNRDGMSQGEVHVYSERQRRKRMRESFSILQSLVPKLKCQHISRITILTKVIKYIQSLLVTLEELDKKRSDIMSLLGISEEDAMGLGPYWWVGIVSYNRANYGDLDSQVKVMVRISGLEVFITLNAPKCEGVWLGVLMLLHRYNVEVVNATYATTTEDNSFQCIHGKVDSTSPIENMDLQDKLERVILKQLSKHHKKI